MRRHGGAPSPSARAVPAMDDEPALRLREQGRSPHGASVALILYGTQLAVARGPRPAAPLVLVEASVQTPGGGGHGPHADAAEPAARAYCAMRFTECDVTNWPSPFSWMLRPASTPRRGNVSAGRPRGSGRLNYGRHSAGRSTRTCENSWLSIVPAWQNWPWQVTNYRRTRLYIADW